MPEKSWLLHVQQKGGRKWDRDGRTSTETFLRDTAEPCIVLVVRVLDPIPMSVEKRSEGTTTDADEAFDISTAKRTHELDESEECEKHKPDSKISRTENVEIHGLFTRNLRCDRHVV